MKRGFIIVNAYCEDKTYLNQSLRLKEELEKLGVQITIFKNDRFLAYLSGNCVENKLKGYDFGIYLDKDKYISQMLESGAIRLFNSHQAIQDCDDKMVTYIKLANNNLPIPKTYSGLLCYSKDKKVKEETLTEIEKEFGYPLIAKCSYGSLGNEVFLIEDRNALKNACNNLLYKPHLFQEFIKESKGVDIRVIVIGQEPIVAMKRESYSDFRSNVSLGGNGTLYEIDKELEVLSKEVAKVLNLDYCGIDFLLGKNGYVICEVNSNAFFGGTEKVTGVNVAKAYANYVYSEIYNK